MWAARWTCVAAAAIAAAAAVGGADAEVGGRGQQQQPNVSVSVSVSQYGAVPTVGTREDGPDACLAFNRTIEAARAQGAGVLRIPKGTYHFHWDQCVHVLAYVSNTVVTPLPPKPVGLWLRGLADLVVQGEGSLLLFHGLMTPIMIDHSRNVTVRNLEIDFPHPSVPEVLVTAANASGKTLDVVVHPSAGFTLAGAGAGGRGEYSDLVFGSGEGWSLDAKAGSQGDTLVQEYDPAADITWRRSNPLRNASFARVAGQPRTLRLTFPSEWESLPPDAPAVGHWLWFRDGGRPNAGLITQFSQDIAVVDTAYRFMSGFGAVAQQTVGLSYVNLTIETTKESGRGCACAADLLHFSGCSGLINVTGGRFVGSQDDGVNVHGTHVRIVAQPKPATIVVDFMQHETYGFQTLFPGDRVQFTRADTLEPFGYGTVKAAKLEGATGCAASTTPGQVLPCRQVVVLHEALVGARLGVDVVENLAYTPDVSITGAYFGRIPTRGVLVTTRGKVVIRGNTFHTPLNRALHIADDAASWFESGPVRDVLYAENTVLRASGAAPDPFNGWMPTFSVSPSNTKNATVHRNLRIVDNVVHLDVRSKGPVLDVKAIAGVLFAGNTIALPAGGALGPADLVHASNCSDVVARNNTVIH